jgi:ATP/ADP translocase
MAIDPIAAKVAEQSVRAAKDHAKAERQKLEDESITIRESGEKFYGNLALFAGGTIALSITYLGYLKSSHNSVVYRKVLIASWVVLLVCAIASLSSVLACDFIQKLSKNTTIQWHRKWTICSSLTSTQKKEK